MQQMCPYEVCIFSLSWHLSSTNCFRLWPSDTLSSVNCSQRKSGKASIMRMFLFFFSFFIFFFYTVLY